MPVIPSLTIATDGYLNRGRKPSLTMGVLGMLWESLAGAIMRRAFVIFTSRTAQIIFRNI